MPKNGQPVMQQPTLQFDLIEDKAEPVVSKDAVVESNRRRFDDAYFEPGNYGACCGKRRFTW